MPTSGAHMPFIRCLHCKVNIRYGKEIWNRRSLPVLRELGIGLVPFSPLGRGFLTGEVKNSQKNIRKAISGAGIHATKVRTMTPM